MSEWSAKTAPLPDKADTFKMKEFFKAKYVDKRFATSANDSDSDDSDRPKKKKKEKKKSKKKRVSSSESSDEKPAKQTKKEETK
jgi:hypothetical protein